RPRRRPAGAGGRGDAADHPLLGGVVELAAPGPDHPRVRRVLDGPEHDAAAGVDAGRHQTVVRGFAAGARARRQPAARGRQGLGAPDGGDRQVSYREYVIAAYAVSALMLAWDYLAPRFAIARQLRAARRLAARKAARPTPNKRPTELGR